MTRLKSINQTNQRSLAYIKQFREDCKNGKANFKQFSIEKHKKKYFGFVECQACDIDFVMFHANDDVVAWEYLWFGADAYEKEIVSTWVGWCKSANTILDIGSYTGLMSVLAGLSNPKAEIHLFEPMDRTIERAKINIKANNLERQVKLHNKAASDEEKIEAINLYREENFLGTGNSIYDKGFNVIDKKLIQTVRIDDFLPDIKPDLVKIDVEGHELACLNGMINTLTSLKPKLIVEVWEHSRREVLSLLEKLGYEVVPFEGKEQRVMNYKCEVI
ncbi:FkbM family methyltransferase [Ectothiorhodospira shaposhnikovii]|uniref:FkbM family methyltransferase n=1 Tax=Ectothiorhodospira shaposhnikovii TaxID=1054 RepID=UPI001EE8495A|nr:FkbM family methyltransferase [Ectothiorhodospira shaposhnikovii]MCG5513992.1 FkbM family methyltransferase [Ectothiorhodospira shaposhnikovii]